MDNQSIINTIDDDETVSDWNSDVYSACSMAKLLIEKIYYVDEHIRKMHRANGFSLPINFEVLAGKTKATVVFKKLNK